MLNKRALYITAVLQIQICKASHVGDKKYDDKVIGSSGDALVWRWQHFMGGRGKHASVSKRLCLSDLSTDKSFCFIYTPTNSVKGKQ